MDRTVNLDKNLLRHIFSIFGILYNTNSRVEHPVLVSIYQKLKGWFISITKSLYQLLFIQQLENLGFDDVTYENKSLINVKTSL